MLIGVVAVAGLTAQTVGQGAQDAVMSGPMVVAILVAVAAGAVSFFSPCCLPLVPGYLSYVAGLSGAEQATGRPSRPSPSLLPTPMAASSVRNLGGAQLTCPSTGSSAATQTISSTTELRRGRTVLGAFLFVAGFAAVFTSYGALFGTFGALLIEHQATLIRVLGALTIVLGLMFAGLFWKLPLAGRTFRLSYKPSIGLAGAPALGILFGLGWTPCIGPTLAAVLTLATSSAGAGRGAMLSFAYSMGLGIPFLVAALSMSRVLKSFGWARRHAAAVMRGGGVFLVVIGILQLTGAWAHWVIRLQGVISSWQAPF